ncbi:MAG TPA: STAS domain-containing protein [Terriglobales bacterium]|nr:STAS domain-containing protein [Terriglobales bacterium]
MPLQLTTRYLGDIAIVDCIGRIVLGDESAALRQHVKELLAESPNIVLNLAQVTYVDSSGVGALMSLYTSARNAYGSIKLANLATRVRDLLQITKLATVFETFDTPEDAAASFNQAAGASAPSEWHS